MDVTSQKLAQQERDDLLVREQNARIEAEKAAETIRRLQVVTDTALKHLSVDDLLNEMLLRVRELLDVDSVAILLLTEDGDYLKLSAGVGLEQELARHEVRVPVGRGIAGAIAQSSEPLVLEDLSKLEVYNPILRENVSSLIGAPLLVKGKVIGIIHADTVAPRRFDDDDIVLLQLVADRIALAIDHAHLYEAEQSARIAAEDASRMKDEFRLKSRSDANPGRFCNFFDCFENSWYRVLVAHLIQEHQRHTASLDAVGCARGAIIQTPERLLDSSIIPEIPPLCTQCHQLKVIV